MQKVTEQRRRQQTYPVLPELNRPASQTATNASESYQQAARARQLQHQIGQSVGLDLNHQVQNDDSTPIDDIQADYANRTANARLNNQLGLDRRTSSAKRAAQNARNQEGMDEALKLTSAWVTKKAGALGVNLTTAGAEGGDALFEDMGITQAVAFVQHTGQALRTIFSPAPEPLAESGNPTDLKAKLQENMQLVSSVFLDVFFSRFNLHTTEGISALLSTIFQWLIIGMMIINIAVMVIISFVPVSLVGGAMYYLYAGMSSWLGF